MRSVWLLALAASGCRSILGIGDPPPLIDAGSDSLASCAAWHPDGFDPCALRLTTASLTLDATQYVYDTTSAGGTLYDAAHQAILQSDQTLAASDGSPIAVLVVDQLVMTSPAVTLDVIGPRPLLIVSGSSIRIDGSIDASSHLGITNAAVHIAQTVRFGAGANQGCVSSAGRTGGDAGPSNGSGGGGGGGLHALGGLGGNAGSVLGGDGGLPGAATAFHGGCPGGASGAAGNIATPPSSAGARALGGAGGGAIRLVARDAIDVRGSISANGAGGAGAPTNSACGGGGGGSGGYIALEAPVVSLGGTITANGGGGGGGGDPSNPGKDGADGMVSAQAAPGGGVSGCGEAGGAGAAGVTLAGAGATNASACGGGGGGGGASGFIVITSPGYMPGTATLSPAALIQ